MPSSSFKERNIVNNYWRSFLYPIRYVYGQPGDAWSDNASLRGIGGFDWNQKPGSLVKLYDAALSPKEAGELGVTPGQEFVYRGPDRPDQYLFNGKAYRYADSPKSKTSKLIDVYNPDAPPDKGVSAATIAERVKIMQEAGITPGESAVIPMPGGGKNVSYVRPSPPPGRVTDQGLWTPPQPEEPVQGPNGAAPIAPVSQEEVEQEKAQAPTPEAGNEEMAPGDNYETAMGNVLAKHSAALTPGDQRVALRTNPDTGSEKIVGNYFIPGDPAHEELLQGVSPENREKLPALSQAINRGGPFSFMYGSAQQEGGVPEWEGERPTGESRQYEQAVSPAQQRVEGAQTQEDLKTILPIQMMATQPKNDNPSSVLLEGLASQSVLNNADHIAQGAKSAKVPVPYSGSQDPNFQRDLSGFLQNQAHGYSGDGMGPAIDETGEPNRLWQSEQLKPKGNQYIPHVLQPEHAQFVHTALNIVPGKKENTKSKYPSFGERARWLRRTSQVHTGKETPANALREQLDQVLPKEGIRNKKGDVNRHVPWSKGVLEPTWRAYRLELIRHGQPEVGSSSMRVQTGAHLVSRPDFRQTAAHFRPAPISQDPAIGSYTDQPGEKITHAAIRYNNPERTYGGYNHWHAHKKALEIGEDPNVVPDEGFLTDKNRFLSREQGWNFAKKSNQLVNAGDEPVLHAEQVQGRKLDSWDLPHGTLHPAPISQDPAIGAPVGEGENITHSALKYDDTKFASHNVKEPRTYTAPTHAQAYETAVASGEHPEVEHKEGFLTNKGRFLGAPVGEAAPSVQPGLLSEQPEEAEEDPEGAPKGYMRIYRGVGGEDSQTENSWSTDKEFARRFTPNGQDHEIAHALVKKSEIHSPKKRVSTSDDESIGNATKEAVRSGKPAIRITEGKGQPNSILFHRVHIEGKSPNPSAVWNPTALASQAIAEQRPNLGNAPPKPLPPQEQVNQPPIGQRKKKKGGSSPSGTTPAGIAEQAVQPQQPSGNF
jgi:hypothetical protein